MKILAIETSCDDTCSALLDDKKIISNVISSQINLHKKWGGVVPDIAKRAHKSRIDVVVKRAMKSINFDDIEVIAVTQGPGLAVALGVGIDKAKELANKYNKKLVAVNHLEGHIMSSFFNHEIKFPALCLTASGGHTKIILIRDFGKYEIVGETLDDAAGEALDKAAKCWDSDIRVDQ